MAMSSASAAPPQIVNVNAGCSPVSVTAVPSNLRVQLASPGNYRVTLTGPSGTVANHVFFDQAQAVLTVSGLNVAQFAVPTGGTFHLAVTWSSDLTQTPAVWPVPVSITAVVVAQNGHWACVAANPNSPLDPHTAVRQPAITIRRR
jgi:hypothetical protein